MVVGEHFEPWVYLVIILPPFLVISTIVYFHAESQGESGFFWTLLCVFLPGLGFLLYIGWVILKHMSDKRLPKPDASRENRPDMALNRQRLNGGSTLSAEGDYDLDMLTEQGQWMEAEAEAKRILEIAESSRDGPTIARMIGYRERIRKRKKGS